MSERLTSADVRRRALRAAAAAAGLSALSCAGPPATSAAGSGAADAGPGSDGGAGAGAADADGWAAADVAADAVAADAPAADAVAPDASAADAVAADGVGADAADAAGDSAADADAAGPCAALDPSLPTCLDQASPGWGTCCQELAAQCGEKHANDPEAAGVCMYGPNYSGQCTGCIPWGPPAPPAFDPAWRPRVFANGAVFAVA